MIFYNQTRKKYFFFKINFLKLVNNFSSSSMKYGNKIFLFNFLIFFLYLSDEISLISLFFQPNLLQNFFGLSHLRKLDCVWSFDII